MLRAKHSDAYQLALANSKARHALVSNTFSGNLMRPHAAKIKSIIDACDCKTVLDFGCGKGKQYQWVSEGKAAIPMGMTIEEYWGIDVTKYDPGYPPFANEPKGKFDLVICTNTLGVIPIVDLPRIIDWLYVLASKALFISERINRGSKKEEFKNPLIFPRSWTEEKWRAAIHRNDTPIQTTIIMRADK